MPRRDTTFSPETSPTPSSPFMCADVQSISAQAAEVQSQSELRRRVVARAPRVAEYVKEKPLVGWRLSSGSLDNVPDAICAQLGSVDNTAYSRSFLAENQGTIIALQMNASTPDFYIIKKATYLKQYEPVDPDEALQHNPALTSWINGQPELKAEFETQKQLVEGARKSVPVEMMKLSDLGYSADQPVTIQSPWGEQTKPAGKDAYLALDASSGEYYLVNQDDSGNPMSYIPRR